MPAERSRLVTPEGTTVDLRLAGLGSRFAAALADLIILLAASSLVSAAFNPFDTGSTVGWAIVAVLTFVLVFGYNSFFELLFHGQTPGKKMNGLRVVTELGGQVDLRRSMIRNLLRLVDILPFAYTIGMIAAATSSLGQRLGDLAAGTVVIVEAPRTKALLRRKSTVTFVEQGRQAAGVVDLNEQQFYELMTWDVSAVTRDEMAHVLAYLSRRSGLDREASTRLADRLADPLRPKVSGIPHGITSERFLELVATAKHHRRM